MPEQQTIYYAAAPAVSTRLRGDEGAVLFAADTGREKAVNATGAFIWARLDGSRSLADLAGELESAFEGVDREQAAGDAAAFLADLADAGFAEVRPEPAADRQPPADF